MRGHRLCVALHLRQRNEFAVRRWPSQRWFRYTVGFWTKESIEVHRSAIAGRSFQGACQAGRPLEAVGNGTKPDRLDAVLALVVGDLARIWTEQKRKRGSTLRNGAVLRPTIKQSTWKP
jgi:hypothetical protein